MNNSAYNESVAARSVRKGLPVFCFLVCTVYLGSAMDPFEPVQTMLLKLTVAGGLLLWLGRGLASGGLYIVRTPLDTRITIFAAWLSAGGLYAINRPLWAEQLTLFLCGAGLFYLVVFHFRTTETIEKLMLLMLLPVYVITPIGIQDFFGGSFFFWDHLIINPVFSVFDLLGVEGAAPPAWTHNFGGRISSTFGNPVYLAGWLVMMLPVGWVLYLESRTVLRRLYTIAAVVMMEVLLIGTFTRSAWLSCLLSLVVFALLARKDRRNGTGALPGIAVTILVLILLAVGFAGRGGFNPSKFSLSDRVSSLTRFDDPSLLERVLIWKTAVETARHHPYIGVGPGNYQVYHPVYQQKFFSSDFWKEHISYPTRVHNEFLDVFAETGIPGIMLFVLLLSGIGRSGFRAIQRRGPPARLAAGLMAGGAGLLLYSNAQFPLHVISIGSYAWIFAGMIVILGENGLLKENFVKFRNPARKREKTLLAVTFSVLFAVFARNCAMPVLGQIAFEHGATARDHGRIEHWLQLMDRGIFTRPGDLEMSVRYSMKANLASRYLEGDRKAEVLENGLAEAFRGLKYHPWDSRLHFQIGVILMKMNKPSEAIAPLEETVRLDPLNAAAFFNLGKACESSGLYKKAAFYYNKAVKVNDRLPGIYIYTGRIYSRLGYYRSALESFNRAIEVEGASKETFNSIGRVYSDWGKSGEAVSNYRRALELDQGYADARGNLALELIAQGKLQEARQALEKILESNPGYGIAHYHLGRVYYMVGDIEEAKEELEKAVEYMDNPGIAIELLKTISGGGETR